MNYQKIYNQLIENARLKNNSENEYYEIHHIIPSCVGGTSESNNLVKLTAREHFVAHKLLCKLYNYRGIRYAYCMMVTTSMNYIKNKEQTSTKRYYRVSSRDYSECVNFLKQDISNRFKGKIYINNGEIQTIIDKSELNNYIEHGWKKGKLPFSEEALESIRLKAKLRVLPEEVHNKKSNSVSGSKNPAFNTKMMNKNGINKRVNINEIQLYQENGWVLGMICKDKKDRIIRINQPHHNKAVVKGKLRVHTETKPYIIRYSDKEDFDYYINVLKWYPGGGTHIKESEVGKKIHMFKRNPFKQKNVPIELKDLYLSRNWEIGNGNYYKSKSEA